MNPELEDFYIGSVLPKFKVLISKPEWEDSTRLGGDEFGFWFSSGGRKYLLIWVDFQQAGLTPEEIEELLGLKPNQYELIMPYDEKYSPSVRTPEWKYEEKFVGWFTLLELR